MSNTKIVSDPMDSVVDYECMICGAIYSLEPDAGIIICDDCGTELDCDIVSCLTEGNCY